MPRIAPRRLTEWVTNTAHRKLRPRQAIKMPDGQVCTVLYVTDCAACVRPMGLIQRTFTPKFSDKEVTVKGKAGCFYISPHSEVEILQRRRTPHG